MVGIEVHLNLFHLLAPEGLLLGCLQLLYPQRKETFMVTTGAMVCYRAKSAEAVSMLVVPACSSDWIKSCSLP